MAQRCLRFAVVQDQDRSRTLWIDRSVERWVPSPPRANDRVREQSKHPRLLQTQRADASKRAPASLNLRATLSSLRARRARRPCGGSGVEHPYEDSAVRSRQVWRRRLGATPTSARLAAPTRAFPTRHRRETPFVPMRLRTSRTRTPIYRCVYRLSCPARLFWTHVRRRPHDHPESGTFRQRGRLRGIKNSSVLTDKRLR